MNRPMTRRAMLTSAIPTAALAATATTAAFRALLAARSDVFRRRAIAEAVLMADPDNTALEAAMGAADRRLLTIERNLLGLTIRADGHGSVRVDNTILT